MHDSTLEARIAAIEDRAALHDMLALIARAIDRYDGAALTRLIDPQAVIDMGGAATMTGAAFAAQIKRPVEPRPGRMHVLSNVLVTLDGDAASSECQITSWQDQLADGARVTRVRAGRYLDRFARTDTGWRLTARTMIDEWSRIDPVGQVAPQGRYLGQPAPDDLLYGHFA
jgi:hypothetical protein